MSAKIEVLEPDQADHEQSRRPWIRKTQGLSLVRKGIADWIVKNKKLKLRPIREVATMFAQPVPEFEWGGGDPCRINRSEIPDYFHMPFVDLPEWLMRLYAAA